jgi:uncharacterized protein (DUF1697 family)
MRGTSIYMPAFVSLFRGINVGGRNTVRMDELKALHESLGFTAVITYIQSGNVVFSSDEEDATQLIRHIEDTFANKFGFSASVIVRSSAELQAMMANNPFQSDPQKESKWVLVLFLASRPEPAALADLQNSYHGPEEFYLIGQELFIYYPEGIGRSKLTVALMEKKLKTVGTGRNWNTILRLRELMQP